MARAYYGVYPAGDSRIVTLYNSLFVSPPEIVGVDTETRGLRDRALMGFAIAFRNADGFHSMYFDFHELGIPWHLIMPSPTRKVYHNAPFDLSKEVLGMYGADLENIEDNLIIARMQNVPAQLEELSYDPVTGTQVLEYKTETARHLLDRYSVDKMYELPFEAVAEKCCLDALVTLEYFLLNKPKINQNHYERRRRFTVMLLKMSHRGLKLNQTLVQDLALQLESDIARFKGITDAIGFNPNSTEQVSYMLSTQGVIIPLNRNHKPTTDAKILSQIDHPWAALTLASRRVNKLYSTYVKKWKGLARAYSHFRQDATTTRTKSSDDNLQNIPTGKGASDWKPAAGRIRNVFVPDDEGPYDPVLQAPVWTRWDLSQVELRTFAQLVERDMGKSDMKWYLDFKLNNPDTPAHQVPDLHTETQEFFHLPNRLLAKRGNFGMIFGGSDEVLAEHMELDDPRKVAEFKRGWENRWPVEAAWIQMQREKGLRELKAYTLKGQEMDLTNTTKMLTDKHVMNSAIAWPVQGSAAELFQEINIEIVDGIGVPEELIALHVHDEGLINGYFDLPWDALSHLTDLWTPFEHSYLTAWE